MSKDIYKIEMLQEIKYIPVPKPFVWNIFEKHRGKRVFNVPDDVEFCAENPDLVLKSDYDKLVKDFEELKKVASVYLDMHDQILKLESENKFLKEKLERFELMPFVDDILLEENKALKEKILTFEGMTFSDDKRIEELVNGLKQIEFELSDDGFLTAQNICAELLKKYRGEK